MSDYVLRLKSGGYLQKSARKWVKTNDFQKATRMPREKAEKVGEV